MRVTLKMVAEKARLSISGVSRALRRDPSIPVATQDRVQTVATELGYVPDPALAALVTHRHGLRTAAKGSVIVFLQETDQEHAADRIARQGVEEVAVKMGYRVETESLARFKSPAKLERILLTRNVAGLIVGRLEDAASLRFDWARFCAVSLTQPFFRPPVHIVRPNFYRTARTAFGMVIGHRFRRPGLLIYGDRRSEHDAYERSALFEEQRGLPEKDRVPILRLADPKSHTKLDAWMERWQPDVVISHVGGAFLHWCSECGVNVPDQVAFLCLAIWPQSPKSWSGYEMRMDAVGRLGMRLLDAHVRHRLLGQSEDGPLTSLVSSRWCPGRTYPYQPENLDAEGFAAIYPEFE